MVEALFSSQSRFHVNMFCDPLSNSKKLEMTATQFIIKMKASCRSSLLPGKHVDDDDELKGYIIKTFFSN
jgi:hypothetical protein